jgi:chromate transporter
MPVDVISKISQPAHEPPGRTPLGHLFTSFAAIGAVMFGGGYAMLPLLEREVVDRRRWCSHDEMSEYYALAQIVPGVIAINIAMLIGSRHRGVRGAVIAALGTVTAPFLVILLLAMVYRHLSHLAGIQLFFAALRPAVAGLLLAAAWGMLRRGCRDWLGLALALAAAALLLSKLLDPVRLILAGFAVGMIWHGVAWRRGLRPASPTKSGGPANGSGS